MLEVKNKKEGGQKEKGPPLFLKENIKG